MNKQQDTYLKLLHDFQDVPINDNDEIAIEWHGWPEGTDRFEILHYFDEKIVGGVVQHLN